MLRNIAVMGDQIVIAHKNETRPIGGLYARDKLAVRPRYGRLVQEGHRQPTVMETGADGARTSLHAWCKQLSQLILILHWSNA